jgi:cell division protein ZapE
MQKDTKNNGPEAEYQALLQIDELKPDAAQARAVAVLEQLYRELIDYPEIGSQHAVHFRSKNGGPRVFYAGRIRPNMRPRGSISMAA